MPAMATRSRYISPSTGEYEVDGGNFREDTTLLPSIVLALRTRKGSCAIAPWLGSKLHEVRHVRANAKAWRTMRSTPLRVEMSSSIATSSGVPLFS